MAEECRRSTGARIIDMLIVGPQMKEEVTESERCELVLKRYFTGSQWRFIKSGVT